MDAFWRQAMFALSGAFMTFSGFMTQCAFPTLATVRMTFSVPTGFVSGDANLKILSFENVSPLVSVAVLLLLSKWFEYSILLTTGILASQTALLLRPGFHYLIAAPLSSDVYEYALDRYGIAKLVVALAAWCVVISQNEEDPLSGCVNTILWLAWTTAYAVVFEKLPHKREVTYFFASCISSLLSLHFAIWSAVAPISILWMIVFVPAAGIHSVMYRLVDAPTPEKEMNSSWSYARFIGAGILAHIPSSTRPTPLQSGVYFSVMVIFLALQRREARLTKRDEKEPEEPETTTEGEESV